MKVEITGRKLNLREGLKEYIEKEVSRLEKYFNRIVDVQVTLEGKMQDKTAKVEVNVPGEKLVVTEKADKFEIAVENAVDKLVRQLKQYKDKLTAKR